MQQRSSFTVTASPGAGNRVTFIASTRSVDRHGTILDPEGCDAEAFLKNPVFLWNHRRDGEPDDVIGTVIDVQKTADSVVCVVAFDTGRKAQQCLRRVRRNILRAVSVGFIPLETSEPDADGVITVKRWELCELSLVAVPSNRDALRRSWTLRAMPKPLRTFHQPDRASDRTLTQGTTRMNPADVLAKLGIAEGAKPEEIAAALLKFCTGSDPEADKLAVIMGVLSMLAPAPSASSASDGAAEAAAEAMAEEVKCLQARVAELEAGKAQAEKAAEPTAEQRADEAVKAGRWPVGQRAALIEQFKANKTPFLFAEKTFSVRGVVLTQGGNPIEQRSAPNFGNPDSPLSDVDNTVLNIAKRAGLNLTPETFAAAKAARQ